MAASRVYVGGIPSDCRERDLEKFFRGYGKLRDCLIKNGYGFVEFDSYRDADDAVYDMNGRDLMGMRVTVEHARGVPRTRGGFPERDRDRRPQWSDKNSGPAQSSRARNNRYGPPTRTPYRCYVENLSSRISWQDLKDYMRKAGTITFADAHRHRRNEGIVEFASYGDLKRALSKLDDTELCGRRIKLVDDYKKGSRSRSRSKSRSKSRSRSRSRSRSDDSRRSRYRSRSRSNRKSRSRSRGRDRSRSRRRSRSHSKSNSPRSKSRSRNRASHSRSRTHERDSRSRSRSRGRSKSRSPAKFTVKDEQTNGRKRDHRGSRSKDSHSKSPSRSRSRSGSWVSPKKDKLSRSRSRSRSPRRNGTVSPRGRHSEDEDR